MNVIIRLQNLPWSANALDIRQFFKGLSIPDGGVHIVGGEMGDAFIAFSTDEDARQAMMHDREAINGVQVRLLLSSRAEMQKVIETARQQSLRALQNASTIGSVATSNSAAPVLAPILGSVKKPQPPVITTNSLQCILSNSSPAMTSSFLAYQQQAGITLISNSLSSKKSTDPDETFSPKHRERNYNFGGDRNSDSRSHSRSRSRSKERSSKERSSSSLRRRRDTSRERSRDRDGKKSSVRRRSGQSRDHSHNRSRSRSRDHSREKCRDRPRNFQHTKRDNKSRSHDAESNKSKLQNTQSWSNMPISNESPKPNQRTDKRLNSRDLVDSNPSIDGNDTKSKSLTSINNYSLSSFLNRSRNNKGFALQNPYTATQITNSTSNSANVSSTTSSSAIPGIFVEKKSDDLVASVSSGATTGSQETIVFADTNPYEKMYPNLFAQAAAIGTVGQKCTQNKTMLSSPISPKEEDIKVNPEADPHKTRCVKIMNMCPGTTYSDIRKFCVGLYIPHNGIKMVNDSHGLRVGIAYVQFSKNTCVARALSRSNQMLRNKPIVIESVSEEEFESITDSFHPDNRDRPFSGNRGDYPPEACDSRNHPSNPFKSQYTREPFCVLYIEDIPALTTEQDIMKMFSSYTLYDILLLASPDNRREFVAHVRFSREEDAISAYEDKVHHQIGYRRLRVRPGSVDEMERAKEKIRLANEQLMKEEQAAAEEEDLRQKKAEAKMKKQKEIISLDLTQSDGDDDANCGADNRDSYCEGDENHDFHNFIENTNKLIDKVVSKDGNSNYHDRYDSCKGSQNQTDSNYNIGIPSLFDFDPNVATPPTRINDPRLRKLQRGAATGVGPNNPVTENKPTSNFNNFNPNFNDQQSLPPTLNNIEQNFVILKNCDYGTRINDVAQLLITANLALKHIEPLRNDRQLPTGEFIVEFRKTQDAETAINRFHNIQFMNRSLRVFPITPQEIADRLCKPFLSYIPGGKGIKVSDLKTLAAAMNVGNNMGSLINNMDRNGGFQNNFNIFDNRGASNSNNSHCNMNEDNDGPPERFFRPGCVLELENVPYKAQLSDILNFFHGFDLKSDDIIRRFNDNGQPTGDARVAFDTPEAARKAFEARKRKQIFNRTIYLNIL